MAEFASGSASAQSQTPSRHVIWWITPSRRRPRWSASAARPCTRSRLRCSVVTSPSDPAVSSPTGDLEADSANPATSLAQFKPITVGPGQTATIPVTITPTGASGTQVSGTLYLDDAAFFEFGSIQDAITNFPQGDQVAAIPYTYTVK